MILLREVPGELMDSAEVQLPTCDHAKNAGKSIGRMACSDALRRNGLRHVKALCTERKHRGERMLEVQLPRIDLGYLNEHEGGAVPI